MTDLVTFGETMLRLSPPGDTPLELADSYAVHVAGAESNVAVAASRLGLETAWLSKLPDDPRSRLVTGELRRHGVEPVVAWADEGRLGTYYLETADRPRGTNVVYDREGAAVHTATPADLAVERVEDAGAFLTCGITPALSDTLAETTEALLARANDAGTTAVFDVNYRSKLWSPAQAREGLTGLFPRVDVLMVSRRDAEAVLGRDGEPATVAGDLADEYDLDTAIVTRGDRGAVAVHDGETVEQPAVSATDAHPIGTGDAFLGGFLAKRLRGEDLATALAYGAATAALKRTVPGDVAAVSPADVERVLSADGDGSHISR